MQEQVDRGYTGHGSLWRQLGMGRAARGAFEVLLCAVRPLRATSLLCVRVLLLEEGLLRKGPSFLFFALRVPLFSVPCLFAWDGRSFTAPCPLSTETCT